MHSNTCIWSSIGSGRPPGSAIRNVVRSDRNVHYFMVDAFSVSIFLLKVSDLADVGLVTRTQSYAISHAYYLFTLSISALQRPPLSTGHRIQSIRKRGLRLFLSVISSVGVNMQSRPNIFCQPASEGCSNSSSGLICTLDAKFWSSAGSCRALVAVTDSTMLQ